MNIDLHNCRLCPRSCGVDRYEQTGFCGAGEKARVALVSLHPWEEPCLTGDKGAGILKTFYEHTGHHSIVNG